MRHDKIKTTLVVLWAVALGLGVITFLVVFYPTVPPGPSSAISNTTSSVETLSGAANATGSTSSFAAGTTTPQAGTGTIPTASPVPGQFSSSYAPPYPLAWTEGNENFSLTAASYQGNQLTLTLAIQMGSVSECVPVNVRLVADEAGTLRAPDSPAGATFSFPDTQSCNGTAGAAYSESLTFNTDSVVAPFLLTTGGTSNSFFFAATTTTGGVSITLPATRG